jgi:hypothetical protein
MARLRKSLSELKMSGTFQVNKKRYEDRMGSTKLTLPVKPLPKRVPGHLSKDAKAAWREIVNSMPEGTLTADDSLTLEVTAKLVAKSRTEDLKPAQLNQIANLLIKLRNKGQPAVEAVHNEPEEEKSDFDLFFDQCAKEDAEDRLIRAEMQRRTRLGPQSGQSPKEYERWSWWSLVRDEFEK